jgi:hypothetical protein
MVDKVTRKEFSNLPWLHVHGQWGPHQPASLIGTVSGLSALRDALTRAIDSGAEEVHVFATDGEGYAIQIVRTLMSSMKPAEYLDMIALQNGREWDKRQAQFKRAIEQTKRRPSRKGQPPSLSGGE